MYAHRDDTFECDHLHDERSKQINDIERLFVELRHTAETYAARAEASGLTSHDQVDDLFYQNQSLYFSHCDYYYYYIIIISLLYYYYYYYLLLLFIICLHYL